MSINRVMYLLESSQPEKRNRVAIAISGQSITDPNNKWPEMFIEFLRRKYPDADIDFMNFAVGGFSSQRLWKKTLNDIRMFKPDLFFLNVTGSHYDYETIVKTVRENTIADIMLSTYHITPGWNDWSQFMSDEHIPLMANKYKAFLCNVHAVWKQKVTESGKSYMYFLSDDATHLNDHGQKMMFEIIRDYMVYTGKTTVRSNPIRCFEIGKDVNWENGVLELEFDGNAVFTDPLENNQSAQCKVSVNGLPPSLINSNYYYTRICKDGDYWKAGGFLKAEIKKPADGDEFTIKFTSFTEGNEAKYTFVLYRNGELTEGRGSEKETLSNEFITIEPSDFFNGYPIRKEMPEKYTFRCIAVCGDELTNGGYLIQGLENHRANRLRLVADDMNNVPNFKHIYIENPDAY